MTDQPTRLEVLPSPREHHTTVDVANVFKQYDKNKTGAIEIDELRDFMSHLGLLNGRSPAESNALVVSAFANADSDKDNALSLQEFTSYYHRATAPRLGDILKADHPEDMIALRQAFINWASFGGGSSGGGNGGAPSPAASRVQLGSAHWLKLCRDTGLVGRGALNSTDADLIFAKVKPRGLQKINFTHFIDALGTVATRLNRDLIMVLRQVTTSEGPVVNGTTVNFNHYNSTEATTTRAAPARLSVQQQQQQQQRRRSAPSDFAPSAHLSSSSASLNQTNSRPTSAKEKLLIDSSNTNSNNGTTADLHSDGFKILAHRSDSSQGRSSCTFGEEDRRGDTSDGPRNEIGKSHMSSNIEQVLRVFGEFAGFGTGNSTIRNSNTFGGTTGRFSTGSMTPPNTNISTGNSNSMAGYERPSPMKMEMDSKQFLKLCKDSGLSTTPATAVAVDLCFAKAKARGARRLAFADFLVALALLAQEKKCAEADVLAQVAACSGPRRNSTTTPEFIRLHDNKETYTGVYARGGPRTVDSSVPDLAKLLSREQGRRI